MRILTALLISMLIFISLYMQSAAETLNGPRPTAVNVVTNEYSEPEINNAEDSAPCAPCAPAEVELPEINQATVNSAVVNSFTDAAALSIKKKTKPAAQTYAAAPASGEGRQITVTAYAYCIHGRTASGSATGYGTIAVDPGVIPMGSKIYVPGYGWGVASDTGGSIQGSKIDIWYPSTSDCLQWGVRDVTITVMPK
ncbi:MAG: 3D domain-containing protein [bacterium]|nr:3D domain-containing protein [bacterium]